MGINAENLQVASGKPGSIEYTKNINLDKIRKSLPKNAIIEFNNDANKNGKIDGGDYFTVTTGNTVTTYYSVRKNDRPANLIEQFDVDYDNFVNENNLKKDKNNYPIIREDSFLKITKTKNLPNTKTTQPTMKAQPIATHSTQPQINEKAQPTPLQTNQKAQQTQTQTSIPLSQSLVYPERLKTNQHFKDFLGGLEKNKSSLMKDLNLSEKEYNDLAQLSLVILEDESQSGTNKKGWTALRAGCCNAKNLFGDNQACPSLGATNIKLETKKELYDKTGKFGKYNIELYWNGTSNIESDDNIAAAATMILLSEHKNNYNKYLQNIASNYRNDQKERVLTLNEYLIVRWKGIHINEFDSNSNTKNISASNVNAIVNYRKDPSISTQGTSVLKVLELYNKSYK